jgi:hypothetical protein
MALFQTCFDMVNIKKKKKGQTISYSEQYDISVW